MTINPIDMQVVVPRAGEVERVSRTVQGQQQTDQQILNEVIKDDLQRRRQTVNELNALEHSKIQKEEEKEQGKEKKQSKKEDARKEQTSSNRDEQEENKGDANSKGKKGRYIDIRI